MEKYHFRASIQARKWYRVHQLAAKSCPDYLNTATTLNLRPRHFRNKQSDARIPMICDSLEMRYSESKWDEEEMVIEESGFPSWYLL